MELITALFGFIISWILLSKPARDKRFAMKMDAYMSLAQTLSSVFLCKTRFDKTGAHEAEYRQSVIDAMRETLSSKLVVSEKVNDASMKFIELVQTDADMARAQLNSTFESMRSELGLDSIDILNQVMRIESFLEFSKSTMQKKPQS